jgi:hypothetical protein
LLSLMPPRHGSLKDLEDAVDRALRKAMAGADRNDAVEPIGLRRRLKHRADAKVLGSWIDGFAFVDAGEHVGGAVPHAAVCHRDQRAVVCLEPKTNIERRRVVVAEVLPVVSSVQHLSGHPVAFEDPPDTTPRRRNAPGVAPTKITFGTARRIVNNGAVRSERNVSGSSASKPAIRRLPLLAGIDPSTARQTV